MGRKRLHGQFPLSSDEKLVDTAQSYWWFKFGDIKGETDNITVAAQDHSLSIKYCKKKNLKEESESKFRRYKEYEENTDNLTSRYPTVARNDYTVRHGKICTHLHYSICEKWGIETAENWYSYVRLYVNMEITNRMESRCKQDSLLIVKHRNAIEYERNTKGDWEEIKM